MTLNRVLWRLFPGLNERSGWKVSCGIVRWPQLATSTHVQLLTTTTQGGPGKDDDNRARDGSNNGGGASEIKEFSPKLSAGVTCNDTILIVCNSF